ncbi:hypothetical protein AJ80_04495 [Polytolypa hystricis UAMH7299]|uniref:Cut9 interacting protein Scn1 n=1 Tax=Polytolypa hystricis (strain UAMH7299) TaxID=1447883 RepID=A0A2B7YCJ5_POLH7|nr:hypothetical protein AJ80_04495 [Polytolypa hystricis UAMH7299]
MTPDPSPEPFPWSIGIHDAHCHPTDTMSSIPAISSMKARTLTVMSTRREDQALVDAVARDDKTSARVIPSFGWHPWYAHQIFDDTDSNCSRAGGMGTISKEAHYTSVLTPPPTLTDNNDDTALLNGLPTPLPLSLFIRETRARLTSYPSALVGEIGLDRSFRIPNPHPLEGENEVARRDPPPSLTLGSREGRALSAYKVNMAHQKAVFKAQLQLAGEMGRAVSVHSVQAHGAVFEVLSGLWKGGERKVLSKREIRRREGGKGSSRDEGKEEEEKGESKPRPFPPRICMHSYSGPPEALKQFLHPAVPADIYFSFSSVINFSNADRDRKVQEVLRSLPDERILVESDLHVAGERMDEVLEEVVRKVCEVKGWGVEEGVGILERNWRRFVFG